MEEKNFRQIMKKVKKIERHQSLESFVLASTNLLEVHTLKMREEYSSFAPQSAKVYQELSDLEFADLVDFKNKNWEVYGNIN